MIIETRRKFYASDSEGRNIKYLIMINVFCLSTISLLEKSMLKNILIDNPELWDCRIPEQVFIKYKGRKYCWIPINSGKLVINKNTFTECDLNIGDKLLSIRSSNIAFTPGVKGPIIEHANKYTGEIKIY